MEPQTLPAQPREEPPNHGDAGKEKEHRLRKPWLWTAGAILLGLVVWLVVAQHGKTTAAAAQKSRAPMPIPVVAATAHKGDIGVYFTGLGADTPIYTVTVRTRVDGELMQVFYKEGQRVERGRPLAEIDPRPFQVQLTQAQGQLRKDEAALANARTDLARYQELIKRNAVAQQILATQEATVMQDEGAVKTDQGNIDAAKLNITYCHITSPITGRVGLRLVDPGNIVHTTDANGLMVITQMEPISVIFTISEDQLPPVLTRLRAGQQLQVDAYDRELATKLAAGRLATIDNQIDPTTGTLKLRAIFANKDDALFPNQFVNARLLVEEKHGVTLAPTAAVQRNAQTTFVYLVKPDQTVTVRTVTVGTTEDGETEIDSGLSPGDVVVTTGVDKLQEGSKVNAQITGAKPAGAGK
jgi:membrane fusion protein, multidrug efflux system